MNIKHISIGLIPASLLSVASVLALAAPSQALVINPGFESGLSSWSSTGDVSTTGTFSGFAPPEGVSQALLNTGSVDPNDPQNTIASPSVGIDDLETFLGLNSGVLGPDAQSGSGLKQTFTLNSSGFFSFQWRFLGETSQPDFAVVVLDGAVIPLATAPGTTGLQTFNSFFNAGTYNLGIGIVNAVDFNGPSQLLVDNFGFDPNIPNNDIPVPPQFFATAIGAGIGALKLRLRKAKTMALKADA